MQKTILCYGDSNTWGYVAGSRNYETMYVERFDRRTRWPGVLQAHLGESYYVVEEGLNGRTTNLDDPYPPDRNGKTYLPSCLYSHAPLDLVILSLGGNDLKAVAKRTAEDVCAGLTELVDIIQGATYGPGMQGSPQILILSQSIPLPISESLCDENGVAYFAGGIAKAKALVPLYQALSRERNCHFLDVTDKVIPSEIDGMHFDKAAHFLLAEMVFKKVSDIFSSKK